MRHLKRIIAEKDAIIAAQAEIIKSLEERITELERRLNLHSQNSNKPPSTDPSYKKPQPTSLRPKGQNPSGGQKGHTGHTLAQVENPTFTVRHTIENCAQCGLDLHDQKVQKVIKRQVFDIPKPTIEITEHQAEIKICSCGHTNIGKFPKNITAPVQYGQRVKVFSVYLLNQQLIPEDRVQQTFADLFAMPISTASLISFNCDFSKKVENYQAQVLADLKNAPVKHMDETGIRIGKKTQWLHVISNDNKTHYRVSEKRKNIFNDVKGVVVHDHFKSYFSMEGDVLHALCNAHHLRELKALEDIEKERWAKKMGRLLRFMNRHKAPLKSVPENSTKIAPIKRFKKLYDSILKEGLDFHEKQDFLSLRKKRVGHNLLIRLRDFKDDTLRFLTTPNVPFTNNLAEQDIRMMKVKQKISGGFRTMHGADVFCIIRAFLSTKRKQGENLFSSIENAFP
jgi:transposase